MICIILISLPACLPFNIDPPPPTPTNLTILYTPAISWIQENIHACALAIPEVAIATQVLPVKFLEFGAAEVILKLGPAPEDQFDGAHVTVLGQEQIVAIASPDITPGQIEFPDVKNLYTTHPPEFQVWQYPLDSELRELFNDYLLFGENTTPHALLVPDPEAMLDTINSHPNSVGYIPRSILSDEYTLSVSDAGAPGGFTQPILSYTAVEPVGNARLFLHCLSETLP